MNKLPLFTSLCAFLIAAPAAAQTTGLVPIQGVLTDKDGKPIDGEHRLTFILHDEERDESALFTDDYPNEQVTSGHFIVYLGSHDDNPLDLGLFAQNAELWVETIIDGTEVIQPRARLGSVPYAGFAQYCGGHTHDWADLTGDITDELVTESELQSELDDRATPFGYDQEAGALTLTDDWLPIPDLSVSINLKAAQPVLIGYSLSVAAQAVGVHCNFRFVVDGAALGHPVYGNVIAMGTNGEHWHSVADFAVKALPAGAHTVTIQGSYEGAPGGCVVDYPEYSTPTLFAMGTRSE
jgi:hypothetical protein